VCWGWVEFFCLFGGGIALWISISEKVWLNIIAVMEIIIVEMGEDE
jgi:hypothetical protein